MANLLENQSKKRQEYLDAIILSDKTRKIIVAGPGTGKTYTFHQLFLKIGPANNLALTFIRKLKNEMEEELGGVSDVRTFHNYCKMLLHKRYGGVNLVPFLESIIREDAESIRFKRTDFRNAFQNLMEEVPEVKYYLMRGDYYQAVSFDDSVFKVYQAVIKGEIVLPKYDQIVIDEFQDFNALEAAFINQLEKKSPILIVGDDDQAVYRLRNASPNYLRSKWQSGEYEVFELPFCSRCPRVVVEATSAFITAASEMGNFTSRVPKSFIPYLEGKEYENETYPKIISATAATIAGVSKFIELAVSNIPVVDIQEAHQLKYPCILIVGPRQYLNPIHKKLRQFLPQIVFSQTDTFGYSLTDGYRLLLINEESNLGWRILAGCELPPRELTKLLAASHDGTPIKSLLSEDFIFKHSSVLVIIKGANLGDDDKNMLRDTLGEGSLLVIDDFFPPEEIEPPEPVLESPTVLFSSFEGCKGLSAGHVFIVGLNGGVVPRQNPDRSISDFEFSKFIVAMTRTRKSLYLLSNRWDYGPSGPRFTPSVFLQMIPGNLQKKGGYMKVKEIEQFF